jgi:hypothetical protein
MFTHIRRRESKKEDIIISNDAVSLGEAFVAAASTQQCNHCSSRRGEIDSMMIHSFIPSFIPTSLAVVS